MHTESDVIAQLNAAGIQVQALIFDKIVRKAQDRNLGEADWYVIRRWKSPKTGKEYIFGKAGTWRDKSQDLVIEPSVQQDDVQAYRVERSSMQKKVDEERVRVNAEAAAKAEEIWLNAKFGGDSPYIIRKGIKPHTARFYPDHIVLSIHDIAGKIHGIEEIYHDGRKNFLTGMAKKGNFHLIGDLPKGNEPLAIVEGFATGASIREAMGWPVVVAFDCGNLEPVAKVIRAACPRAKIILAADDDHHRTGNPGITHAQAAAKAIRGTVLAPEFQDKAGKTDWNDLHAAQGLAALRDQLEPATRQAVAEVDIMSFEETVEREVTWIWPGVIPRGLLCALGGKQGLGKSFVVADLAARVSNGDDMPDGFRPSEHGENVLILPREDPADCVLKPRIRAACGDMRRIFWSIFRDSKTGGLLDLASAAGKLHNLIVQYDIRFVIVDTYAAFAAADSNQNDAGDVRNMLNALADVARDTGAAIMIVAHLRKAANGQRNQDIDPMDSFAGSAQMTAGVRVASMLEPAKSQKEEGVRWFRPVKTNLGLLKSSGWTWVFEHKHGDTSIMPRIKWSAAESDMDRKEKTTRAGVTNIHLPDLAEALVEVLATGPQTLSRCGSSVLLALQDQPAYRKAPRAAIEAGIMVLARERDVCESGIGGRKDSIMIALPGQLPETTRDKAFRLARENPGISVRKLKEMAGCSQRIVEEAIAHSGVPKDPEGVPELAGTTGTTVPVGCTRTPTDPLKGSGSLGTGTPPASVPGLCDEIVGD